MSRGVRFAIAAALTLLVVAGGTAWVLLSRQSNDGDHRVDWDEPHGPRPQHWRLLTATEEHVVFGPERDQGRRLSKRAGGGAMLIAMDPAERVNWEIPWRADLHSFSPRWARSSGSEQLIDLTTGEELTLPGSVDGSVYEIGELLVHYDDDRLRAFDPANPTEPMWTVAAPSASGVLPLLMAHRFADHTAVFLGGRAVLVDGEGEAHTLPMPGHVLAATDDTLYVQEGDTLRCVQIPSGEPCGELTGVRDGLSCLGSRDGATLWHEATFDFRMPSGPPNPWDRTRIFAWVPGEDEPRWSTPTPNGSLSQAGLDHAWGSLPRADQALTAHACWPIEGERETPTNGYRNVRVVCLETATGAITYRGSAGADGAGAIHDDDGTVLLVSNRHVDGAFMVRLHAQPVAAVFLGEGRVVNAGRFVWRVDGFGNVRRWDSRDFEADPDALARALGPELPMPPDPATR